MGITQLLRELPTFMVILYKSSVKQYETERTTNAIAKYSFFFFFTRGAKTVISNMKLPFTVDFFFVHLQRLSTDGEMPKANGLQEDIYTT